MTSHYIPFIVSLFLSLFLGHYVCEGVVVLPNCSTQMSNRLVTLDNFVITLYQQYHKHLTQNDMSSAEGRRRLYYILLHIRTIEVASAKMILGCIDPITTTASHDNTPFHVSDAVLKHVDPVFCETTVALVNTIIEIREANDSNELGLINALQISLLLKQCLYVNPSHVGCLLHVADMHENLAQDEGSNSLPGDSNWPGPSISVVRRAFLTLTTFNAFKYLRKLGYDMASVVAVSRKFELLNLEQLMEIRHSFYSNQSFNWSDNEVVGNVALIYPMSLQRLSFPNNMITTEVPSMSPVLLKSYILKASLQPLDIIVASSDTRRFAIEKSSIINLYFTCASKLKHDEAQIRYLLGKGILPSSFLAVSLGYRIILNSISHNDAVLLNPSYRQSLLYNTYNQRLYVPSLPRQLSTVVNLRHNWTDIAQRYHQGQVVVIDDFFNENIAQSIFEWTLAATGVWNDIKPRRDYVGSLWSQGFDEPLFFQIVDELRTLLPSVFRKEYKIANLWAYKYSGEGKNGISVHADAAAVNLNFWVTPNSSNLDPNTGGLLIYPKEAPADWNFSDFNFIDEGIHNVYKFLDEDGKRRSVRVPYRFNRAVLFISNLFHETDEYHFKDAYEHSRVNCTILMGTRQQGIQERQHQHS